MRNKAIVLLTGTFLAITFFVAAPEKLAQESGKVYTAKGVDSATFTVNTAADTPDANPGDGVCSDAGGACSLRAAISEANALAGADIIMLPPGRYRQSLGTANEDANAGGDWDISSVIVIRGSGEFSCVLEAAASPGTANERVLNVRPGGELTLSRVTVRNGRFSGTVADTTRGAGIENLGVLVLDSVIVRDNEITSNNGDPIGAGIYNAGTAMALVSSSVTGNTVSRQSGGSAFGGGIASTAETTITVTNSYIGNNNAFANGGFAFGSGLYLENRFTVNMSGVAVANNVSSGTSGTNGSGVSAISNAGAAAFNATGCEFRNNSGSGSAGGQGIGLYFLTTGAATLAATLDGVKVKDNIGTSTGVGIGATLNGGNMTLNILRSSITNNIGGVVGGGIFVTDAGPAPPVESRATVNLTNTTLSNNTANNSGGGLALQGPLTGADLNHVTIARNSAEQGGGILLAASGTVNIKNSIVGDNSGGTAPDIAGAIVSGDYNHIENLSGAMITGTTTHNTNGDALLGLLVEHAGGSVHLPGPASPVLNSIPSGTNGCGTTVLADQRSAPRPQGGACDKGSVERVVAASIGGRVLTSGGRPIRNAVVTLSGGSLLHPLVVRTGPFGWYNFPDLAGEETYVLTASAKRFDLTGNSPSIYLIGDISNLDFVAAEPF